MFLGFLVYRPNCLYPSSLLHICGVSEGGNFLIGCGISTLHECYQWNLRAIRIRIKQKSSDTGGRNRHCKK